MPAAGVSSTELMSTSNMSRGTAGFAAGVMAAVALMAPVEGQQAPAGPTCRITGKATSTSTPLPGVALTVKSGAAVKGATSTDVDGGFAFTLTPGEYTLSAELTGFGRIERPLVVAANAGPERCTQTVDLSLSLTPRQAAAPGPLASTSRTAAAPGATAAAGAGGRGATPVGGRGRGAQPGTTGFQTLEVRQAADATAAADTQLSA